VSPLSPADEKDLAHKIPGRSGKRKGSISTHLQLSALNICLRVLGALFCFGSSGVLTQNFPPVKQMLHSFSQASIPK
jgi:hypothetical protein